VRWPAFSAAAKDAGFSVRQVLLDIAEAPEFPTLRRDFEAFRRDGYLCAQYQGGIESDIRLVAALALQHRIAVSFLGPSAALALEGYLFQYWAERIDVMQRLAAATAKILR